MTDNLVFYPFVIENDSTVINSNQVKPDGNLKKNLIMHVSMRKITEGKEKNNAIDSIFSSKEESVTQLSTLSQ